MLVMLWSCPGGRDTVKGFQEEEEEEEEVRKRKRRKRKTTNIWVCLEILNTKRDSSKNRES